jgi:hypothetical protein
MDDRLEKALAFSKYRVTIENRRKALKRRYEAMTVVHYNNGMFVADQTTIAFVAVLLSSGHKDAVVIDARDAPIDVDDLAEFRDKLLNAYFEATNEYATEMKRLAVARDVKKAMDW